MGCDIHNGIIENVYNELINFNYFMLYFIKLITTNLKNIFTNLLTCCMLSTLHFGYDVFATGCQYSNLYYLQSSLAYFCFLLKEKKKIEKSHKYDF